LTQKQLECVDVKNIASSVPQGDKRIAGFVTTNTCKNLFIPPQAESIFRMFEFGTSTANRYDSLKWTTPTSSSIQTVNAIQVSAQTARDQCQSYIKSYDASDPKTWDITQTKYRLLTAVGDMCVEDVYFGVPWTSNTVISAMCAKVQIMIDVERKDMFCANQAAMSYAVDAAVVGKTGPGSAGATSASTVQSTHDNLDRMIQEITESMKNIEYWDDGKCTDANDLLPLSNLASYDCTSHVYRDTMKSSQTSGIGHHLHAVHLSNNAHGHAHASSH